MGKLQIPSVLSIFTSGIFFFIKARIDSKEITIEHCPTQNMIADYFTKSLQGNLFRKLQDQIMSFDQLCKYHSGHRSVLGGGNLLGERTKMELTEKNVKYKSGKALNNRHIGTFALKDFGEGRRLEKPEKNLMYAKVVSGTMSSNNQVSRSAIIPVTLFKLMTNTYEFVKNS
jgi:hypothetical protein